MLSFFMFLAETTFRSLVWLVIYALPLLFLLVGVLYNLAYRLLPTPRNQPKLQLQAKTVLLTGASSGIGREMARVLYLKGAKLILASRSTEQLENLCSELAEEGENKKHQQENAVLFPPRFSYLDLEEVVVTASNDKNKNKDASGEQRATALEEFLTSLRYLLTEGEGGPRLDVLINNAGQMAYGAGQRTKLAVFKRMMNVNFLGHVAITQRLLEWIPDDGAVVVVGSIVGRVAVPYMGAYSAAKHAIQAFFDSLRAEERPQLQILTVSAGYADTRLATNALGENGQQIGKVDPEQVAGMSAEFAARQIVAALERRETDFLLAPFVPRFLPTLRLATPNLLWFLLHKFIHPKYVNFGRALDE